MSKRNSRVFALVVVLALTSAACVRNKQAEPGVKAITTDLQYKELAKKNAAPPNTVPAQPPGDLGTPQPLPGFDTAPIGPVRTTTCPTAAPTEQADEDVTNNVTRLPKGGEYLWHVRGGEIVQGTTRLPYASFTKRSIENVKGSASDKSSELSFETVEREMSSQTSNTPIVRTFFNVTSQTATDNTVRPNVPGQSVSSGRTATSGVRVTRIERTLPNGQKTTFVPSSPIRYLITPVLEGPERFWLDQVVDTSGSQTQSLTHRAFVKGRITIDACGERLRGWLVIAEQTYARGDNSVTRHFEYGVATHLGGIVVFEHVESPCTRQSNGKCQEGEPKILYEANIGGSKPS